MKASEALGSPFAFVVSSVAPLKITPRVFATTVVPSSRAPAIAGAKSDPEKQIHGFQTKRNSIRN